MSLQTAGAVPGLSSPWSGQVGNAMAASFASASVALCKPTIALLSRPRTNDHQRSCSVASASAVVGSQRERLGDLSDPARDCVASANGYVLTAALASRGTSLRAGVSA